MTSQTPDLSMRVQTLPGLREQVAERLRLAIATGKFAPGARLIERELCEMMGVSRTSLREALRELQADGLISLQPNKGLSVSVVTPETARSIYQVRATLEGLAARLFARNASDSQMAQLRKSIDRLAEVYDNFSAERFIAAKTHFYDILFEGAGNEIAAEMLRRIHTRVSQLRVVSLSSAERAQKSIRELRDFMDALEARDEDRAWQVCTAHVEAAAAAALKSIGSTSG
ncbi:GntR family transcriptional regulator [Nitratireductor mangrovi]|uniref:GntR family transcriptional regulator n=1 Tax=Nitratireductor mangrovi TaxID=2599600 RepID=A0A5B8L404_9HYPH|nr:GntR family transcriptional regulator [Nitratireductor mangrovi]QDZ02288.2 GntR family transcriptional regulator [Nitratireductor mangrovi]